MDSRLPVHTRSRRYRRLQLGRCRQEGVSSTMLNCWLCENSSRVRGGLGLQSPEVQSIQAVSSLISSEYSTNTGIMVFDGSQIYKRGTWLATQRCFVGSSSFPRQLGKWFDLDVPRTNWSSILCLPLVLWLPCSWLEITHSCMATTLFVLQDTLDSSWH